MKKTLVALAALASLSAFAQSSVTISGDLWAGVNSFKSSTGTSTTSIGNGPAASRVRFVGVEDMGGGNKANFWLEMQPSLSNGAVNGTALFNRGAWLGLSGDSWGAIRIGRQGTTSIGLICGVDQGSCLTGFNGGGILFNGSNAIGRWISANPGRGLNGSAGMGQSSGGAGGDVTRVINAFTYLTPNLSGFSAQVQYALGGAASGQANGNGNQVGLNVSYSNGPIMAGMAYQSTNADATNGATGKLTTFGGTYNLGVAKVGLIFQNGSAGGTASTATGWTSEKAWALTVTAPFGAATPYLRLGQHSTNGIGAFGNVNGKDSAIFNIGANYGLSKRTLINFDYARDGRGNSGNGGNTANPSLIYVGVEHHF